jgi:hypothetical protein
MVTADTITDEQLAELHDDAMYRSEITLAALAMMALHGVTTRITKRKIHRVKCGVAYQAARARCAEILNTRAKER